MSLVVWLPLNGNLNNQGLSDVTVTNSGMTVNNSGIIGQCYTTTADGNGILLTGYMNDLKTYTEYSMCAWIYMNSAATSHSSTILSSGNWNTSNGNCCFGLYNYSDGYANLLIPNRGGWSTSISLPSKVLINKWYHIAVTYNGTETKAYINGEYVGKSTSGGICQNSNSNDLKIGAATYTNGFTLKGKINDVRIYDHCLSDKEVKEISKGLILHYPLNANVLTYSYDSDGLILEDGSQWIRLLHHNAPASNMFTASTGEYPYKNCTSENLYSRLYLLDTDANFLSVDNYYEFLIREKTTSAATENQFRWKQTSNPGTSTSITGFQSIENPTGSARLIGLKKDQSTYAYAHNGSSWWVACGAWTRYNGGIPGVNDVVTTGYLDLYVRVDNIKYKSGDLICDESGYCNDASIYGNLSISSSEARYLKSIKFTDGRTDYIKSINPVYFPTDKITISCWVKGAAEAGYGNYDIVFCANSSSFEFSLEGATGKFRNGFVIGGSRTVVTTSFATRDNNWHFIAATYDGTNIKRYGDGTLVYTSAASGSLSAGPYDVYMGNYSGSTTYGMKNLSVSDVRVYATALSDDNILELYHTAASVDNTGNLFAYQLNEV